MIKNFLGVFFGVVLYELLCWWVSAEPLNWIASISRSVFIAAIATLLLMAFGERRSKGKAAQSAR